MLSPVPHLDSGIDWPTKAETLSPSDCRGAEQHACCPTSRRRSSPRVITTPLDFQRPPARRSSGAAFGLEPAADAERLVPPAQPAAKTSTVCISSAPAPIPGAGVPGVLSSARVLDAVVPDAHALVKS
ncbi:MAG: hypothetical protein MZV49_22650 [Rhodopseudomonas palustris]|nr:hypothetical protein [Rhodopseudomonas palustris]